MQARITQSGAYTGLPGHTSWDDDEVCTLKGLGEAIVVGEVTVNF